MHRGGGRVVEGGRGVLERWIVGIGSIGRGRVVRSDWCNARVAGDKVENR